MRLEGHKALVHLGARHVCDSSAPSFMQDLTEALAATGATLAFDAIYGGLDTGPTIINRDFGVGGWLLWPFMQRIGPAGAQKLRARGLETQ